MSTQITAHDLKLDECNQNIFAEGDLAPESVIRKFRTTADEWKNRGAEYE